MHPELTRALVDARIADLRRDRAAGTLRFDRPADGLRRARAAAGALRR